MSNKVTVNLMGSNTLLTLVFFIAKITGYITWSWLWVFCPMWIPFLIVIGIFTVLLILACLK